MGLVVGVEYAVVYAVYFVNQVMLQHIAHYPAYSVLLIVYPLVFLRLKHCLTSLRKNFVSHLGFNFRKLFEISKFDLCFWARLIAVLFYFSMELFHLKICDNFFNDFINCCALSFCKKKKYENLCTAVTFQPRRVYIIYPFVLCR